MVRAVESLLPHMWPGSTSGVDTICGLNLLLVHFFASRVFFRVLRLSTLLKNQHFEISVRFEMHGHVAPWVKKSQQFTNNNFYLLENQEKSMSKQRLRPSPAGLKQRLDETLKWPIELTSNLVPKPRMMEEYKGLVNQPMVKRSCHDLIMTQSFEIRQKK